MKTQWLNDTPARLAALPLPDPIPGFVLAQNAKIKTFPTAQQATAEHSLAAVCDAVIALGCATSARVASCIPSMSATGVRQKLLTAVNRKMLVRKRDGDVFVYSPPDVT